MMVPEKSIHVICVQAKWAYNIFPWWIMSLKLWFAFLFVRKAQEQKESNPNILYETFTERILSGNDEVLSSTCVE
jgi:hypothetical protein